MIDLATIALAEGQPTVLKAAGIGDYAHPVYGKLQFTRERLQRLADSVNRRARGISLAIDYEHGKDPRMGKRAAGWIQGADVRQDGLYLSVSFTDEAKREIRAGHWKYLSPEFGDWQDPRTGVKTPDVMFGLGLTNRPFLKDLGEIAASEEGAKRRKEIDLHEQYRQLTPDAAIDLAEAGFLGLVEARVNQGGMAFNEAADQVAREFPSIYQSYRDSLT